MKKRQLEILILTNRIFSINDGRLDHIVDVVKEAKINVVSHRNVTEEMLSKAEIIFGWPKADELSKAKKLSWLHLPSAGADNYTDINSYLNKNIVVTTSSGVYGTVIAEHVFAMILSYNRNLQEYAYLKADKTWQMISKTRDLSGSTVGIIGFGDIGKQVAIRAKAFGTRVLVVKRRLTERPEYVDELYTSEEIDLVIKESDYIVLTLPATDKTKGIISKDRLNMMKSDAYLVNIGRGELIDQEALIEAIREKRIGGAGVDVTVPEPLPADNPLWSLPNVIITSHSSGLSPENNNRRVKIFADNLKRYINNEKLANQVDFTEGY